ncbi:helix-turn-helix domain-containing protein [Methylobacterium sp. WL19]|nr:helix-turn-helix domain-containing protein [Methylobacterium sp. WL19]
MAYAQESAAPQAVNGLIAATSVLRTTDLGCDVALVLIAIDGLGQRCVPTAAILATELGMPYSTVWRHVITLLERGLVRTSPVPKAKRHEIHLTASGEAAAAQASQAIMAAIGGSLGSYAA